MPRRPRETFSCFIKFHFMESMPPRRQIQVKGYNAEGQLIAEKTLDTFSWYECLHPIIDSNEERTRLGLVEIRGWQYDGEGKLSLTWRAHYFPDGAIKEVINQRSDGTSDVHKWKEDGSPEQDASDEQQATLDL